MYRASACQALYSGNSDFHKICLCTRQTFFDRLQTWHVKCTVHGDATQGRTEFETTSSRTWCCKMHTAKVFEMKVQQNPAEGFHFSFATLQLRAILQQEDLYIFVSTICFESKLVACSTSTAQLVVAFDDMPTHAFTPVHRWSGRSFAETPLRKLVTTSELLSAALQ